MIFSSTYAIALLIRYKYALLLPIMVAEGPIIAVIGGLLASHGVLSFPAVCALSVIGDLCGDSVYYCIGRWGRRSFVARWGGYIGLTPARMREADHYFEHHAAATLITAKLTHAAGIFALVAAGASRMPFLPYLGYNLIGTIPKSVTFVTIGYYFGSKYDKISKLLDTASAGILAVIVIACIVIYVRSKKR